MSENIETRLAALTLEEKATLLAGADMWNTHAIPRVGIPSIKVSDGPNGVRGEGGDTGVSSVCTPCGSALGATWNRGLVQQIGQVLGQELKTKGAHVLLAPTVNIHRSPIAGRNFECYSEDPYLTGEMATAYINGVQSEGVGTCIKHFVANEQEYERFSISSEVAERPLREIYLYPFMTAIRNANPWTIMSSYNRINGTHASEHHKILRQILKEEWGYDGYVISDWYGSYSDNVPAGGLDLEMPGPARWMNVEKIVAAVQAGTLDEAIIDDKVRRLLRTIERVGAFDQPRQPELAVNNPAHQSIVRAAAREAIVLLKNEAGLLPLTDVKSIAVIGQNAHQAQIMGGGSAGVTPHYIISPLAGIRNRAGADIQVDYAIGCAIHRSLPAIPQSWLTTASGANGVDVAYFDNPDLAGEPVAQVVTGKTDLSWFGDSAQYIDPNRFSLRLTGTLMVPETQEYVLGLTCVGVARLLIDGEVMLDLWSDRSPQAALPDASEKELQMTLEAGKPYAIQIEYAIATEIRWRAIRLGMMAALPPDPIGDAVRLAEKADVAIVVAGLTNEWEGEGGDRVNMDLPGDQDELIRQVAAANPNTIVVLNAGSPLSMTWVDEVAAVLQSWYGGQESGNALADILFGDESPSGKLPTTFPRRLADNPAYINFPGENGKVYYGEGLFVGYRYYDKKGIAPLFPFGHGLSYTTFVYANLAFNQEEGDVQVTVDVTNSGHVAGHEIVQVYIHDQEATLVRPEKELKAFAKIKLEPGETRQVQFRLTEQDLSFYDPQRSGWRVEAGQFTVLVGRSSQDIRLMGSFAWANGGSVSATAGQSGLHIGMSLQTLLDHAGAREILMEHLGDMLNHPQSNMAMSMSLETVAHFVPHLLTPEKIRTISEALANLNE